MKDQELSDIERRWNGTVAEEDIHYLTGEIRILQECLKTAYGALLIPPDEQNI